MLEEHCADLLSEIVSCDEKSNHLPHLSVGQVENLLQHVSEHTSEFTFTHLQTGL